MAKDIFSKIIKDYNNDLEIILEKKAFSEDVKNLLLSMMYKIENSYDDYKKTKVNVCGKKKFVQEILSTIKNRCDEIEIIKPLSEEGKKLYEANQNCIIDKEENKIKTFQNEKSILDAILKIRQQDIELKTEYNLIEEPLKEFLTVGNNMNSLEILTDFNGWSWDITRDKKSIVYNKVYQLLTILIGGSLIDNWVNNRNEEDEDEIPSNVILSSKYNDSFGITKDEIKGQKQDNVERIKDKLEILYGKELADKFFKKLIQIIILECTRRDENYNKKIEKRIDDLQKEYLRMSDNKIFLEDLSKNKKDITHKIKQIDDFLSDDTKLKKEYETRNEGVANKDKIFSVSHLRLMLEKQRKKYLDEIKSINKKMEPKEFVNIKEELKNKLEFYQEIDIKNTQKQNFIRLFKEFDKIFLNCLIKKIEISETKNQIENLIYEYRYYSYLMPVIDGIDKQKDKVLKLLIRKACEQKVLITVSESEKTNYLVLREILNTKIIDLDTIVFTIKYSKGIITLNIYDGNTNDETKHIEITEKTELNVKLNKKIKIWQ